MNHPELVQKHPTHLSNLIEPTLVLKHPTHLVSSVLVCFVRFAEVRCA